MKKTTPLPAFNTQPWTAAALCAQTDPEVFFPPQGGSTRKAKRICGQCPVTAECLTYALERNEQFGIFGGLSPRQRRPLHGGPEPTPRPRPQPTIRLTAAQQAAAVAAYQNGASPPQIAAQHNTSPKHVRRIIAAAGIPLRTRSQAARVRHANQQQQAS